MFTGIIEELGKITCIKNESVSAKITISARKVLEDVAVGDSIAVNGICLTVTSFTKDCFQADVMPQTMRKSSLSAVTKNSFVNLERAMSVSTRFGGHIVSGHIDGTGEILDISKEENAVWYTISADENILHYVVEKGSIAIDGISLTVAYVDDTCFKVSIIPHTAGETILQYKDKGNIINLECDIIGKYVEKLIIGSAKDNIYTAHFSREQQNKNHGNITMEFLAENGF